MFSSTIITNLTSHDLILEIMQNSFIHNLYVSHINIMHWKHIWNMNLLEDAKSMWHSFIRNLYISRINIMHWKHIWNMNLLEDAKSMWHSFIHRSYFIHQHIYSCVKHVFNAWYLCVKCTNLEMNKFHMVFIINTPHAKFVIITNVVTQMRWE